MSSLYSFVNLSATSRQPRGNLSSIEFHSLPFQPKRIFYVSNVPQNEIRGQHAHYACLQILFCVRGSFQCTLSDGESESTVLLEENGPGLLINALTWGVQFQFASNAVMLCLASEEYDSSDYIHSLEELKEARQSLS